MSSEQNGGLTTTRRTLVKGAAWSVPVVAVAGAAPAMAASQEVVFNNLGRACKQPGNSCKKEFGISKGYVIALQFCTTVRGTVTVDFGTATGTLCTSAKTWTVAQDPLTLQGSPNGSRVCQVVNLGLEGEPDSANCPINGTLPFTYTTSNGLSGEGLISFSAPATPPCDNCLPPA